jgi:hypothetical protein
MAECRLTVRGRLAGWLRCYIVVLIVLRHVTGWTPSQQHIDRVMARGVRCEVVR